MPKFRVSAVALVCSLGTLTAACGDPDNPPTPPNTITDIASSDARFTTLASLLQRVDLTSTLSGEGPFTVFAPTNDAFTAYLSALNIQASDISDADLTQLLLAHVVSGTFVAARLQFESSLPTATTAATPLTVQTLTEQVVDNGAVTGTESIVVVDGRAKVVKADLSADNGVIHAVDAVLTPAGFGGTIAQAVAATPRLSTLNAAVANANIGADLGAPNTRTLFAPTNTAFALMPGTVVADLLADADKAPLSNILRHHVLDTDLDATTLITGPASRTTLTGDADTTIGLTTTPAQTQLFIDGRTTVISTDIVTSNGRIHIIDSVITPGTFPGTVVDAVKASPRFSSLVAALEAAALTETLATNPGTFTLFAPTDTAFSVLNPTTLSGLLSAAQKEDLTSVLRLHVLSSIQDSTAVATIAATTDPTLATLEPGETISFSQVAGGFRIDGDAKITATDILVQNGIVHVIDNVLIPRLLRPKLGF